MPKTDSTTERALGGTSGADCSDLRSPLAKARDEFINGPRGKPLTHGTASGQYLRNRVESAWLAGVEWGQSNPNGKDDRT